MTTKELLDEFKELTIRVYDAERHDYWDKEVQNQKERMEEIIEKLETKIRNEVLDKVKEEMKNKTFMCDQLIGDLVVDMDDISTIIDNLKIK